VKITAFDDAGNTFEKEVEIRQSYGTEKLVVDFGWPINYFASTLMRSYPWKTNLCIDIVGRHHKGRATWVKYEDLNKICEEVKCQTAPKEI